MPNESTQALRRSPTSRFISGLLLFALVVATGCGTTLRARDRSGEGIDETGKIPAADFFSSPVLHSLTISPDGNKLAAIMSRGGVDFLIWRAVGGGETHLLAKLERGASSGRASRSIRRIGWPSNQKIIVSIEMPFLMSRGVRSRQSRLMVVDLDGSIRYLGEDWRYQEYSQVQDDIVDWLPGDADHILIGYRRPDKAGISVDAMRVNVNSGALSVAGRGSRGIRDWHADHRGVPRVAVAYKRFSNERILYARKRAGDRLEEMMRSAGIGGEDSDIAFAGFSNRPGTIYVFSNHENGRWAVYEFDLDTRKRGRKIFGHDRVDVRGLLSSHLNGTLWGVKYIMPEGPMTHWVDQSARIRWSQVEARFPGQIVEIENRDAFDRRMVIRTSSDVVPPAYHLYDSGTGRIDPLVQAHPKLEDVELAPMKPVEFNARDGLLIPGFVTRPTGAAGPTAAIILVHGGPFAQDEWGWDSEVQFLASRGFTVFQMNFRGSTGFGSAHKVAGYKEFGLAMQDDITDGTRWLIESGLADPDRIGIYGASYGGYASLQAAVKTPDLFRAAASFAGVTDLPTLLRDDGRYLFFGAANDVLIGDSWDDSDYLEAVSPARHADEIEIPVLLAHGTEDWRVHEKHLLKMESAIEKAGGEVESYRYAGEVHGFVDERNRIDFYQRLAAFFERHLEPERMEGPGLGDLAQDAGVDAQVQTQAQADTATEESP
jgi:dipeptidyl aminopeptidase/acylaminoacyl peptidase